MRGWAKKTSWSELDKESLTFGEGDFRCEVFKEVEDGLLVPRGYQDFSHSDDELWLGDSIRPMDAINLRDEQVPAVEAVINALDRPGKGAILFAPCGKGKTVMGLEMIRRLGRKVETRSTH